MAANVPVTVMSSHPQGFTWTFAAVNDQFYRPTLQQYNQAAWWWLLLDLSNNLNVVANEITTDGTSVPASVQSAVGNPDMFLICASNWMLGQYFPQGPMADLLIRVGAQKVLPRLEQVVEQVGTGVFVQLSYILAATMAENDLPGFEEYSANFQTQLVFQFMPIQVGSKTIYAPIQAWPNPPSLAERAPKGAANNAADFMMPTP
jgi:hypothetical protein